MYQKVIILQRISRLENNVIYGSNKQVQKGK